MQLKSLVFLNSIRKIMDAYLNILVGDIVINRDGKMVAQLVVFIVILIV